MKLIHSIMHKISNILTFTNNNYSENLLYATSLMLVASKKIAKIKDITVAEAKQIVLETVIETF